MGYSSPVDRSTLATANKNRNCRIYADFAQVLIAEAKPLYFDDNDFVARIDEAAYAFDATTIDLCLELFPWAKFRKKKGAVKVHALLDLRGSIPSFIKITDGATHEVNVLDDLVIEPGAFYMMDKAYIDFERLHEIHLAAGYFVLRAKNNMKFKRIYSKKVNKKSGVQCDQIIQLTITKSLDGYPSRLRRIKYYDKNKERSFVFITNNFNVKPAIVADLYKERWKIELFFKWIKQHLRIKSFYGTTMNAVTTQIWIAITAYLLVAIVKRQLNLKQSQYTILQILSVTLFDKMPILQVFTDNKILNQIDVTPNQLSIWE